MCFTIGAFPCRFAPANDLCRFWPALRPQIETRRTPASVKRHASFTESGRGLRFRVGRFIVERFPSRVKVSIISSFVFLFRAFGFWDAPPQNPFKVYLTPPKHLHFEGLHYIRTSIVRIPRKGSPKGPKDRIIRYLGYG